MQGSSHVPADGPEHMPAQEGAGGEESRSSRALQSVEGHGREVAGHAAEEARGVVEGAVDRLHEEAQRQTGQVQGMLNRTGEQLEALADGRVEDAGPMADYARRAASRVGSLAGRVDELGFDGIVDEVSGYARRRPGRFLLMAAAAGMVAGRVGRNARAASRDGGPAQRPDSGTQARARLPEQQPGEPSGEGALRPAGEDVPLAPGVPPGFGTGPATVGPEVDESRRTGDAYDTGEAHRTGAQRHD